MIATTASFHGSEDSTSRAAGRVKKMRPMLEKGGFVLMRYMPDCGTPEVFGFFILDGLHWKPAKAKLK